MFYEATEAGKVLALKKVGESVWGRLGSKLFVELQGLLISRWVMISLCTISMAFSGKFSKGVSIEVKLTLKHLCM